MTTIKDVARAAGVSTTTVSLVFNNHDSRVSQKTKQRVLEVADQLGYHPNKFAASLVTKKSYIIGLVSDSLNIFTAQVTRGVVRQAREQGYQVLQVSASPGNDEDREYLNVLLNQGIDGVIFPHSSIPDGRRLEEALGTIIRTGLPATVLDMDVPGYSSYADNCDHVRGAYLATQHLAGLGHTRIGVISSSEDYVSSTKKLRGYREALSDLGLPYDPRLVFTGSYSMQAGQDAVPYLLGQDVTAVFGFDDMIALGVYKAAKGYGLSIPKDLSVVGYDDIFLSEVLDVPLTTIHIPIEEIGRRAAAEIISVIEGGERVAPERLEEPHLMVRASTQRRRRG